MPPSLLITNFGNVIQTLATARAMKAALTGHQDSRFNPLPGFLASLEEFGAGIDRLQVAHDAVQNREMHRLPERNDAHGSLKKMMSRYVQYAELVADGDVPLLQTIAAPFRREAVKTGANLLVVAPQLVVAHAGRGAVNCKAKAIRGAFSYQIQFTDGDPGVEGNWKDGIPPSAHASGITIGELISGKEYSFRMRAIGSIQPGPWSNVVTIMIL